MTRQTRNSTNASLKKIYPALKAKHLPPLVTRKLAIKPKYKPECIKSLPTNISEDTQNAMNAWFDRVLQTFHRMPDVQEKRQLIKRILEQQNYSIEDLVQAYTALLNNEINLPSNNHKKMSRLVRSEIQKYIIEIEKSIFVQKATTKIAPKMIFIEKVPIQVRGKVALVKPKQVRYFVEQQREYLQKLRQDPDIQADLAFFGARQIAPARGQIDPAIETLLNGFENNN